MPDSLPEEVTKFIKIWNSSTGQYIDLQTIHDNNEKCKLIRHEHLNMDAYIHVTSPIRRLVDLLNMLKLQQNLNLISLTTDASQFYDKWITELDYINITMRTIRKVQNDCNLLDLCYNNSEILDKIYDGYCFEKVVNKHELYQYIVFLPELKLSSKIILKENLENYEKKQFKLILFYNEEKFKRKIRLHLL